jgi:hypothetical protein
MAHNNLIMREVTMLMCRAKWLGAPPSCGNDITPWCPLRSFITELLAT